MSQIKDSIIAIEDREYKLLVARKKMRDSELSLDADKKRLKELIVSEGHAGCVIQIEKDGEIKIYSTDEKGEIYSIARVIKL